jgi:ABC-type nitrate/sulfonate/bicarbonate transport system substrate-binding protein
MTGTENAFIVVDKGQARIVTGMESFAPDFLTHVVFATNTLVHDKPDLARRFVQGFFASMAMVKADKAKAVAFFAPFLNEKPSVFAAIYDQEVPMLIDDGHFDPKAVTVLKNSFIDMGILDRKPADAQLFTSQFVPAKL